jgi:hypothetical protein
MKQIIAVAAFFCLLCVVFLEEAYAIPAFARKYDMSCTTCHSPFPKLKPFADDFARNGFQLAGQEPARFFKETGDDMLLLMRELPLAIRFEGYLRYLPETADRADFQAPYLIKLLSGGQLAKDISYYFYFFFGEQGEVAGLEDAFFMFNNVFSTGIDFYIGQFQVSDPLFKRELRLTFEDYRIYSTRVGLSTIDLVYDRGIMLSYNAPTHTDITLEILNGSGIGPADADKNFDTDKNKNGMLRLSQDVGKNVRLGFFGYYGNQDVNVGTNRTWMAGPDLTVTLEPVELNVQYVERNDSKPLFVSGGEVGTRGAFAELIYSPLGDKSTWYGMILYNWVKSDLSEPNYHTATAGICKLLARNLRLVGEYTYDMEQKANRFTVGLVGAF